MSGFQTISMILSSCHFVRKSVCAGGGALPARGSGGRQEECGLRLMGGRHTRQRHPRTPTYLTHQQHPITSNHIAGGLHYDHPKVWAWAGRWTAGLEGWSTNGDVFCTFQCGEGLHWGSRKGLKVFRATVLRSNCV